MDKRSCPACGGEFVPTYRAQKYCPPTTEDRERARVAERQARSQCARRAMNLGQRGGDVTRLQGKTIPARAPFDCAQCGTACVPGESVAAHATKFCGAQCKAAWHRIHGVKPSHCESARRRARRATRRRAAERKLAKALAGSRGTVTRWTAGPCVECGTPFVSPYPDAIGCSATCVRRQQDRRARKARAVRYGWNDSNRARARRNGVAYETVSTPAVFRRDHYRCGICGGQTDPDAKVPDPRAPTLDHIVPMSMGGPHLYSNVQCACFECNWRKGASLESDQLRFAA